MTSDVDPRTRVFGIRHHGPGSARSLLRALHDFQPDAILIEGPADADPLVGFVAAEGMAPPVALLAYVPDQPARAAFWPFAVFSPEWQAMRYAADRDIPVHFCDLPATTVLAVREEPGDTIDPVAELAAAAGHDDTERWWDAILESAPHINAFDAITEAMAELRNARPDTSGTGEELREAGAEQNPRPELVDSHTLLREAYMRQVLRKTIKGGARRVAVVCGAWHAPALAGPLGPAAPDARLLKGLPKVKATVTWVPWTHSRLATASGYGAGIDSPGWYHHLFTETEQPVARWLTKAAGVLRAQDLPVSSAHVIESVRLAETLAVLRERPLAGLSEVTEAVRAVMCGGEETLVRVVNSALVVGEALGSVPEGAPAVPLDADLRARIRTLRMKQDPAAKALDLDLRKDRERQRSHLLHRLRLLGIPWGTEVSSDIRGTGTFRESWSLRWRPEFAVAVVEASRWGTTIAAAAAAKVLDAAARPDVGLADLTTALESSLLADLGPATTGLVARLETVAALDHDVTRLLAALPSLVGTLRYGDVRGTDTSALAHVADSLLVRICAGLPGAVTGLDTTAAEHLRALLDAAHTAIHTRDNAWATAEWLVALHRLADREDVHGALVGRAVRLLADAGRIDRADSARRLSAALSIGPTPAAKAAWIDGFLGGRGLLLVHDRQLLHLIDTWLHTLPEDQFTTTLPLLRRTFSTFEPAERRAIATALRTPETPTTPTPTTDHTRGTAAMTTVARILGATP
ncbi:DUF5682 family protein [Nocardia goodfellowii]|uniref:Uncharacterized protein n=1 Tax=Nocardia goodfellowii TaxID=882446 RepID=A0ABS4QE50_9NOCA|nr:DUF5682 family protein [Nocardia goodfellowii]MBP2189384.1 hypothetical protein [Nocardia goodfellowii]